MTNEKKHFQAPSFIQGISTLKDKTLKLVVYISRELAGDEKAMLFDLEQKEGWFMFGENTFQTKDIPQETAKIDKNVKTPTSRLYAVMFVKWKQQDGKTDFNRWREIEMEKIIEDIKSQLI